MTRHVAVIGAGIAGLTCAYRLHRLEPSWTITVYEAGPQAGGKVRTSDIDGIAVDEAVDGFLARVPAGVGLCRELGLDDRLVSPASRTAYVYRNGRLHRFPDGLVLGVPTDLDALRRSGVVSDAGVDRAAQDLTLPGDLPGAPAPGQDESVGALVRRRVGDEVFEALVGPLLSGVNAGNADELSLAGGAPQFAAAVADPGRPSLIEGLARQKAAAATANPDPDAPVFHALRGGMQTLTDALVAALPAGTVEVASPVTALVYDHDDDHDHDDDDDDVPDENHTVGHEANDDADRPGALDPAPLDPGPLDPGTLDPGADVATDDEPAPGIHLVGTAGGAEWHDFADAVVLAVPTWAAAALIEPVDAALAGGLATLVWSSVVLVTFVVRRGDVDHDLDASGFLVAESEGLLMTACSFGSSKWPHWRSSDASPPRDNPAVVTPVIEGPGDNRTVADPEDEHVVLRVSAGRHHRPEAWGLADDELVDRLLAELGATIGLHGTPVAVRVSRWERSLPQYRPGHLDRARNWKAQAATHPGLFLTGAGYQGLGLPACIADAEATAAAVRSFLTVESP